MDAYRSLYYLKKESTTCIRFSGRIHNGTWRHETKIVLEGECAA